MSTILDYNKYAKVARKAGSEGCVLLQNEKNALPIMKNETIALFGRMQVNSYYCGMGSGGMVNAPYVVSILEGIKSQRKVDSILEDKYLKWLENNPFDIGVGWATEPICQKEMPIDTSTALEASKRADVAVIIIGRTAGEDKDITASKGEYFLNDLEEQMLKNVCESFDRVVVVLNTGNIINMAWVEKYKPSAVLYVWHGGSETGNSVADVLTGHINPSGNLPDTIAHKLEDYPSHENFGDSAENVYAEDVYVGYRYFETFAKNKVIYPFGFGLSYTTFSYSLKSFDVVDRIIVMEINITNTGTVKGKKSIQIYVNPPQGKLGKPLRNLVAFSKTKTLMPNETETLNFNINIDSFASFDDIGKTGYKNCFLLEKGEYDIFVGFDVRSATNEAKHIEHELKVVNQLSGAMPPNKSFMRIRNTINKNEYCLDYEKVPKGDQLNQNMLLEEPSSLDSILENLTNEELACITRGEGMCSPKVTMGTAGAFGGVTEKLQSYGIPICCCADGPSGIRMDCGTMAFSIPNGTSLASTFNVKLVEELFDFLGLELVKNKIDTILGPGLNIHRHPLNGRNFEYFSEDPYLTGHMVVAELNGMHRHGVTGTIKHFACNNQEYNRNDVNSLVSGRALREIYLKGFEIAVKEGNACSIMSAYNPINGTWAASNYDLLTRILRDEWNFKGIVMSDWWAKMNNIGEEAFKENAAAMLLAQNDLYMVTKNAFENTNNDNIISSIEKGILTRLHLIRSAKNIINFANSSLKISKKDLDKWVTVLNEPKIKRGKVNEKYVNVVSNPTHLESNGCSTQKGSRLIFKLNFIENKDYILNYSFSSKQSELSQMPVSVFIDNVPITTITLSGTNSLSGSLPITKSSDLTCDLELFFGESGIYIDELFLM